jgi:hypothetical protein
MKTILIVGILVLAGCGKVERNNSNGQLPSVPDEHGVVCYTWYSHGISCVKVK